MKLFVISQRTKWILYASFLICIFAIPFADAATYTWNSGSGVGSTDWNTASNWNPDTIPGTASSDVADFGDPTDLNTSINISSSVLLRQINFSKPESSGYHITGTPGETITVNLVDTGPIGGSDSAIYTLHTSGTNTIDADIVFGAPAESAQAVTVYRAGTMLVLNGSISTLNELSYVGYYPNNATIFLTGTNTYTANSRFSSSQGSVWVKSIGNSGEPGSLGAGTAIEFTNPTTLRYLGTGETTTKNITFVYDRDGGGVIDGSGESGLMIAGDVTSATAFAHTLTLKGDSTDVINGISGNITDGDGTVSVFISSGQWTLSGNNNFSGTGNRIYKDSCLNINSDTALGTGTWTVDTTVTIDNTSDGAVTLTNNPIFSNMGSFIFTGTRDLNLGAGNVTLTPSTTTMTINRGTLSIGGDIGQSAADKSLTKEGTGTLALSGNNTWSGTTRINGGVLLLNSANALPGGIGTSNGTGLLMLTGGVAGLANGDFTRPVGNAAGYVRFYSDGGFAAYGEDRVVNLGGESDELTWASTANFLGNARTLILGASDADKTVDFQNPVSFGNAARTIQADDGSADVDGKISGVLSSSGTSGSLVKTGSGTLELAGDNTYTGSTTVEDGRLLITGTTSDQGSVSIKSGATLGGTGSLGLASGKNLTVEAGGTLSSGITDVGTFTINGDVVMTADAVYSWKYNNGDSSLAVINGDLQLPSVATVAVTSVCGTLPTRAILMTANSLSGETDLSDWVVEPYYVVKARGKNVEIVESNPRTLIFVQ